MIFRKSGRFSENDKFVQAAASKKWEHKTKATGTPGDSMSMPEELPIPERNSRTHLGSLGDLKRSLK